MGRLSWVGDTLNATVGVPAREGQRETKLQSKRRQWKQRFKQCDGKPKNVSSPQKVKEAKGQTSWHLQKETTLLTS